MNDFGLQSTYLTVYLPYSHAVIISKTENLLFVERTPLVRNFSLQGAPKPRNNKTI